MSNKLRCPKCKSDDVDCQENPHRHLCLACGYDGTTPLAEENGWVDTSAYELSPGDLEIIKLCAADLRHDNVDLYRRAHDRHAQAARSEIATYERQMRAARRALAMREAMIATIDRWKEANTQ